MRPKKTHIAELGHLGFSVCGLDLAGRGSVPPGEETCLNCGRVHRARGGRPHSIIPEDALRAPIWRLYDHGLRWLLFGAATALLGLVAWRVWLHWGGLPG